MTRYYTDQEYQLFKYQVIKINNGDDSMNDERINTNFDEICALADLVARSHASTLVPTAPNVSSIAGSGLVVFVCSEIW